MSMIADREWIPITTRNKGKTMTRALLTLAITLSLCSLAAAQEYDRAKWPHWKDPDGNCRDARHDALVAWAKDSVEFNTPWRCDVKAATWICPYTGERFTDPSDLDADHVVPLRWAHAHGGRQWAAKKKERFANDPTNIIPVKASANRAKGAKPPWRWLPPRKSYRCTYLMKWRELITNYELALNRKESRALEASLGRYCKEHRKTHDK